MNDVNDQRAAPMKGDRPIYFVSDRPEAYEIFGEVGHAEAKRFGQLIAACAGRHFPAIEFRVDSAWHSHQHGMEHVAAYIEAHWQEWVAESATLTR